MKIIVSTLAILISLSHGCFSMDEILDQKEKKNFSFSTKNSDTRSEEWAQQIVDFCDEVLIGKAKQALKDMGLFLFNKYPELSFERQDNIASNVPRAYSALSKIEDELDQIEYIKKLQERHVKVFDMK